MRKIFVTLTVLAALATPYASNAQSNVMMTWIKELIAHLIPS